MNCKNIGQGERKKKTERAVRPRRGTDLLERLFFKPIDH